MCIRSLTRENRKRRGLVHALNKALERAEDRNALHTLRKEYGSLINAKYDLVTAKEHLRHSSVAITAAHYVENRKRGTTGLGALLTGKIVELPKAKEA
jgi:integrase